jgi:hypothetical protein
MASYAKGDVLRGQVPLQKSYGYVTVFEFIVQETSEMCNWCCIGIGDPPLLYVYTGATIAGCLEIECRRKSKVGTKCG